LASSADRPIGAEQHALDDRTSIHFIQNKSADILEKHGASELSCRSPRLILDETMQARDAGPGINIVRELILLAAGRLAEVKGIGARADGERSSIGWRGRRLT
jgi:hypothetical protein